MYFPKGYDRELALELGNLVRAAYEQYAAFMEGKPWVRPAGYEILAEICYDLKAGLPNEIGLFGLELDMGKVLGGLRGPSLPMPMGFVARKEGTNFLIFRGTKTAKEWVRNFTFSLRDHPVKGYGKVHDGFLATYHAIGDSVRRAVALAGAGKTFHVAGHSLGSALATFAAIELESAGTGKVGCLYTFASPRIGDARFAQAFDAAFASRSFRIANTSDLVTTIPLPVAIAGFMGGYFAHTETPIDFTRQLEDLEKNHSIHTYLEAIGAALPEKRGFLARLFGGK